jgi:ribonuclease P protein component
MAHTFTKEERLSNKVLIKKLFEEGQKRFIFPFRVTMLRCQVPSDSPVQLLISVPRSQFRKATDRNRIKRMIREAYRTNKHILYDSLAEHHEQLMICIQYTPKEIHSFQMIREKIIVLLQRLKEENAKSTG